MSDRDQLDRILMEYFNSSRPYRLILERLREVHGISRRHMAYNFNIIIRGVARVSPTLHAFLLCSLSWLKKQFKRLSLYRRSRVDYTPIAIVKNCIRCELRTSNSSVGYRVMWRLLQQKYRLVVKRDTVMMLLRQMDAENVLTRRRRRLRRRIYLSRGPDFVWHLDGYDKLSPFGFHIHGCIDGFSRKIIWLKVASTNRNSSVILQYYLESINEAHGCPSILQFDCGTEHALVASTQYALREHHHDTYAGDNSFRFGRSTSNTLCLPLHNVNLKRIEALWCQLRKHTTGWWIDAFKEMEMQGYLNTKIETHRKCLAIVFLPLLEYDVNQFAMQWNNHKIRESHHWNCISGIPNDLHDMPNYYDTVSYLQPLNMHVWLTALMSQATLPPPMYDGLFYQTCYELVLDEYGLDLHSDITHSNAVEVYKFLIHSLL